MPDLNLDLLEPNDNTITIAGETLKVNRVPLYVMLKAPERFGRYVGISKQESSNLSDDEIRDDFEFLVKCLGLVLKESEKPEEWILEHFDLLLLISALNHVLYVRTEKKRPAEKPGAKSTGGS